MGLKQICDEKYVYSLRRNLAKQGEIPVSIRYNDCNTYAVMFFGDRKGEDVWLKVEDNEIELELGQVLEIAFFNREMYFVFDTSVILSNGNLYRIEKPVKVNSSFRRLVSRHKVEDGEDIVLSILATKEQFKIIDINTMGLSFISPDKFIHENEILRNVAIKLPNDMEVCVDGRIGYCRENKDHSYSYGLIFTDIDWSAKHILFTYIFDKSYPNIKPISDFSVNEIYNLYNDSGYLNLKSKEEMDLNFMNMIDCLQKLNGKTQVASNIVYCSDNKLLTAASVLRVYNRTFLAHQLASVPAARLNIRSKIDVYLGLVDYMINHPYFEYYLTYFIEDLSWHNEIYKKMCEIIDDHSKVILDTLYLYKCNIDDVICVKPEKQYVCEVIEGSTDFLNYCRENLEHLEVECYAYDMASFDLKEIKQVYEILGLYMNRRLWHIKLDNKVVAYAVAEVYNDGLNLFNVLDMCRIYFFNDCVDREEVVKSLLQDVSTFFMKYRKSQFNMLFKTTDISVDEFFIQGFGYPSVFGRIMATKEGGAEYKKLLMMSYR